jgi:calcineurin-like phosphoesterase family protein
MIFFTSDTHFQHANVIKHSKRPFSSVEEMNAAMVSNWRNTVHDEDVVYHLGDFAWNWNAEAKAILASLPGTKHLITGNHDHSGVKKAANWASVAEYCELELLVDQLPPGAERELFVVLCHYPFAEWNGFHRGSINLYGHVHVTRPITRQQMDVGVDCCNFTPISLPEVLSCLAAAA